MSTLAMVEEILRETEIPMSVRQIVVHAKGRLPTRSRTPETVVARDLSMDIKKKGEASLFIRTEPGRYTIRAIHLARQMAAAEASSRATTEAAADVIVEAAVEAAAEASGDATPMTTSAMHAERAGPIAARASSESDVLTQSTITGA